MSNFMNIRIYKAIVFIYNDCDSEIVFDRESRFFSA